MIDKLLEVRPRLSYKIEDLMEALKVDESTIRDRFTDGRTVTPLVEYRIGQLMGWELERTEIGGGIRLIDKTNRPWVARSISATCFFTPSSMRGVGRVFNREEWEEWLSELGGFVVYNALDFPDYRVWLVPSEVVFQWWARQQIGPTAIVSAKVVLDLLDTSRTTLEQFQ